MYLIDNQSLSEVSGGISKTVMYLLGTFAVFVVGIIVGIVNPKKCG